MTTKTFLLLIGMETLVIFNSLTSVVKAQPFNFTTPITAESKDTATKLFERGKSKLEQQNYRGAIADLSRAIQLNPNQADFYYQRGSILGELGDKEGAIRDFDNAILRNPNHAWAYLSRAGMSFNLAISSRVTNSKGIDLRTVNYRQQNAQAMLDLRTARDLFAQQGNQKGFQTADSLINHFARRLEQQSDQEF